MGGVGDPRYTVVNLGPLSFQRQAIRGDRLPLEACTCPESYASFNRRRVDNGATQMPAYQAYPPSGAAEPRPLPKPLSESVTVRRLINLTLL